MSRAIVRALAIGEGNPALLDTATGALSREAFTLRVEEAAALAGRLGHAVSIVRIELSRPGDLRNRYGAESVDALLAEMVDRLWGLARLSDTVARIGSERLAVLLPATDRTGAARYAARVRPYLEATPYRLRRGEVRPDLLVCVAGATSGERTSPASLIGLLLPLIA